MLCMLNLVLVAIAALLVVSGNTASFIRLRSRCSNGAGRLYCLKYEESRNEQKFTSNSNPSGIPKKVLNDLKRSGANVTRIGTNHFFVQNIHYAGPAWNVLAGFAESSTVHPVIYVNFELSDQISSTCLSPSHDQKIEILREALSIVSHYAHLMANDFDSIMPPPIPGPLPHPPILVSGQHSTPQNSLDRPCWTNP